MGQIAAAGTHLYGRRSYELFRSVFTGPAAGRTATASSGCITRAPIRPRDRKTVRGSRPLTL